MKTCPKCHKQFSDDANFCPVCAARLHTVEMEAIGKDTLTSRFDLGAPIGGGRTGTVHRATELAAGGAGASGGGKPVAIKLVSPTVTGLPGVAQRLERELKQLERLTSTGVAKVLASGKRGDDTWIAMELLEGAQTLEQTISARGPIDASAAAELVQVIGEALIEAAQVGVVHRDLAPKNVVFSGEGVKLINFSLPVPSGNDKVPGVTEFVAPEQQDGKPVDQRSNIWALGALYYYVLTGKSVTGDPVTPPSQLASVPAGVEQAILRALDKSPTKRFLTVRQMVDEVARVAVGGDDMKATLPIAKVGETPKRAEMMQTLLGVRSGVQVPPPVVLSAATAHAEPPAPAAQASSIASAPTVGGVPALQPSVMVSESMVAASASSSASETAVVVPALPVPVPNAPSPMASTMIGIAGGVMSTAASPAAPSPAPSPEAAPVAAPAAAVATSPAERSPWAAAAPEAAPAPAPATMAPVTAPAAAAAAAAPRAAVPPVTQPPVVTGEHARPAGRKKSATQLEEERIQQTSKGKFRETMWFKKGELDAQAAQTAVVDPNASTDKADTLPIDERYKDDGSISRGDKEKYSLRTGATQVMAAVKPESGSSASRVSEDALIGEMKGGRNLVLYAIIGGALVVIALVVFAVTR